MGNQTTKPPSAHEVADMAETEATGCPLTAAINAIGGKWNLIVLYWLDIEKRRFTELRRLIPDVSHKVLTQTLRDLESEGLIERTVHALSPSHVEYAISAHGQSVRLLVHIIRAWGREHLDRPRALEPARDGDAGV